MVGGFPTSSAVLDGSGMPINYECPLAWEHGVGRYLEITMKIRGYSSKKSTLLFFHESDHFYGPLVPDFFKIFFIHADLWPFQLRAHFEIRLFGAPRLLAEDQYLVISIFHTPEIFVRLSSGEDTAGGGNSVRWLEAVRQAADQLYCSMTLIGQ